jgi:hypothetical protein
LIYNNKLTILYGVVYATKGFIPCALIALQLLSLRII